MCTALHSLSEKTTRPLHPRQRLHYSLPAGYMAAPYVHFRDPWQIQQPAVHVCIHSLLPSINCLIASNQTFTAGVSGHARVVNVGGDHITHNHDGLGTPGKSTMHTSYGSLSRLLQTAISISGLHPQTSHQITMQHAVNINRKRASGS